MSQLPTIATLGACRVSYRYGSGPVLGAIRIGSRNGVAYWMQADRTEAPATSRNAWTTIGPVDAYAGHAEAADAYARHHQAKHRLDGIATIAAPVAPVDAIATPSEANGPLEAMRADHEAAHAHLNAVIAEAFPGMDEWHYLRACAHLNGENTRRNNDTSHDAALVSHIGICAAWADYMTNLHAFYRARDGAGGVLGGSRHSVVATGAAKTPLAMVAQPVQQAQGKAEAPVRVTIRDNANRQEWHETGPAPSLAFERVWHRTPRSGWKADVREAFEAAWLQYRGERSSARRGDATITIEPAPAMVPQPCQQQQGRDQRRGMAYCEEPGMWRIGIYSVERDAAGCWVATATGPGTSGEGSPRRFGSLALAYQGVTGEPMPGYNGAGVRMVRQPVQQAQGRAPVTSGTSRAAYYRLCQGQPTYWLEWCVSDPGPYMRPRHIALIRLCLRNRA